MCPQVDERDVCSSHGECMSMARLAEAANLNGDATAYTYGAQTHRASTWDSNSMFGCKCDEGYHGYDCSLSTCPFCECCVVSSLCHGGRLCICILSKGVDFAKSMTRAPPPSLRGTGAGDLE